MLLTMRASVAKRLRASVSAKARDCVRAGWFGPLVLILAGVIPYLNGLWGEFHFDDSNQIVERADLGQLSVLLRNVPHSRALTFTTYALNYRLHGLEWMPGWHLANIALHVACVLVLYWLLRLILRSEGAGADWADSRRRPTGKKASGYRGRGAGMGAPRSTGAKTSAAGAAPRAGGATAAFIGALLFAVHPLATEPVNYVQARAVILYTLFTLLAVCGAAVLCAGVAGLRATGEVSQRRSRGRIVGGAVLACGSVLLATVSKEVGVFFALACSLTYITVCLLPAMRWRARTLLISAGAVVGLLVAVLVWMHVSGMGAGIQRRVTTDFFWPHLRAQLIVFWEYILLAVLPLPSLLSVDHYVPLREYALSDGDVMAALLGLAGLVLLPAALLVRTRPALAFLLLFIPLGIAPYFVMASPEMMVEYRFYLPLAAFCGLAGMGVAGLLRRYGPGLWWWLAGLVLLLAIITVERNRVWRTDVTLWADAYEKAPRKARTVNGLAWALLKDKTAPDPKRALRLAEESFDPRRVDLPLGYNPFMVDTLAEAYFANGDIQRAIEIERDIMYKHGWATEWFIKQLARFEAAASQPATRGTR
jgi:protein O-mannosyl-transferase